MMMNDNIIVDDDDDDEYFYDKDNNIRISKQTRNVIASTIRADITFVH